VRHRFDFIPLYTINPQIRMQTATEFPIVRNEIAGFSALDLAKKFGTPAYFYDASTMLRRVEDLRAFDVIRYAQKACSNIAILDRMRRWGVTVDAVSAGEIRRAMAAGYVAHGHPHPIVFTADIFDQEALDLVAEHGIHVNCGSPDMIEQLGKRVPGANITLRINPGFGHGHSRKTNTGGSASKHGIWFSQVDDCLRLADLYGITVTGIHMHIGSGTDMEHLSQVCGAMERIVNEVGRTVTSISAGGGLPVPYREGQAYVDLGAYFELWDGTRNRLSEKLGHRLELEIEPGRYLSAESGYLLTEVRAVKRMGENLFYVVDAGFNDLARPILYGAYHPIALCPQGDAGDRPEVEAVVGGPLCESGDIFTQEEGGFVTPRRLPLAKVGDLLVIGVAGAYGFVMASNYNSKLRAAEVLLEDGQTKLIRRRETFADLIACEQIPS
jgi:diaminopimelate decarboxylase